MLCFVSFLFAGFWISFKLRNLQNSDFQPSVCVWVMFARRHRRRIAIFFWRGWAREIYSHSSLSVCCCDRWFSFCVPYILFWLRVCVWELVDDGRQRLLLLLLLAGMELIIICNLLLTEIPQNFHSIWERGTGNEHANRCRLPKIFSSQSFQLLSNLKRTTILSIVALPTTWLAQQNSPSAYWWLNWTLLSILSF